MAMVGGDYNSYEPSIDTYTDELINNANASGIYCYMKHFALDEQETERLDINIWCNEQAMREIYFKPFELCVKEGGVTAAMASDSFIGATWAGEREELMNTVLRDEWGFRGMVITDFVTSDCKMQIVRSEVVQI